MLNCVYIAKLHCNIKKIHNLTSKIPRTKILVFFLDINVFMFGDTLYKVKYNSFLPHLNKVMYNVILIGVCTINDIILLNI